MNCSSCGFDNAPGMRFCGMCGTELKYRVAPSGERRRVTTVFVDLVSFSSLTRDLDPEELRDIAAQALNEVTGVIEGYDGYVDSIQGDGLFALFGAPISHPDDPLRAVLAAAASLNAIERAGAARGLPLKGRAGVNTGIVIAGAVGSGRLRNYTVMGSSVNLTSRLEEAAEPGEVLVGLETYMATRHRLKYESRGPLELQGFPGITAAHKLVTALGFKPPDPNAHVRFVARQAELAWLKAALEEVASGRASKELWLHGEQGSGKTRLLREFSRALPDEAAVLWMKPRPYEEFSWRLLGRQLFGLRVDEEEHLARQRVRRTLNRYLPGQPLAQWLVLRSLFPAPTPEDASEQETVASPAWAWRDLLVAVAHSPKRRGGTVLIVENEPKDSVFQEFLELLKECQASLLLVRTSRERLQGRRSDDPTRRELPLLSQEESIQLLEQVVTPGNHAAAEALVGQVGGIPAHVLELGRALSLTHGEAFSGSLARLLQARIDLLPPPTKRLLSEAALLGEVTWEGLLLELGGDGATESVKALQEESLLVPQASAAIPGEVELRFQSQLIRSAAIDMIPFSERPHVHLKIAAWLERFAPLAFSEMTAAQFELGGSPEAAYAHYLAAADLAASRGEPSTALRIYRDLLDLELAPETLAEGALAYLQAAIDLRQQTAAAEALEHATELIDLTHGPKRAALELILAELRTELGGEVLEPL